MGFWISIVLKQVYIKSSSSSLVNNSFILTDEKNARQKHLQSSYAFKAQTKVHL